MAEVGIEEVGAVGGANPTGRQIAMDQLIGEAQAEMTKAADFSQLVEDAIGKAVERPHTEDAIGDEARHLTSAAEGVVGTEKVALLSDVARPGATPKPETTETVQQQTEARVKELYVDLTNYQVAWKIAQRIQQDITQLMRGS